MKPVKFRLYPEKQSRLHALVYVWPTRKEMLEAWRARNYRRAGRTCQGFCSPVEVWDFRKGTGRKQPLFAEVHVWRGKLTMAVVTHEMFHAAIAWARRVRFNFSRLHAEDSINDDEERLTYAHSNLCRDFMIRATDAGLYQ